MGGTPKSQRGRILRLRPGVMANFSGGYGYMPYVLLLSVPLSLISQFLANDLVYGAARRIRHQEQDEQWSRVSMALLQDYLHRHLRNCAIVYATLGGLLAIMAAQALYEQDVGWYAWTLALAGGPFAFSLLSTVVVGRLTLRWGPRAGFLFAGLLAFVIPFLLLYLLLWLPALWS